MRRKEKAETKAVERLTRQSSGATAAAMAKKASTASEDNSGGGSGFISVMLAHNYDPDKHNPTGWLMSEKLDGVRCYWDGATMYTRQGNVFHAPQSFKDKLPKMELDGELWTNRDDF